MPETTAGATGFLHGCPHTEFTDAATQDISLSTSTLLNTEVRNKAGQKITHRSDDILKSISITLKIKGTYTRPTIGGLLTIVTGQHAGEYRVTGITEAYTNGDFATFSITAESNEFIDLTPA